MTAIDDLIRRQDAIDSIQREMRRTWAAVRRRGYRQAVEILESLPGAAPAQVITLAEPTEKAQSRMHAHWFAASGWLLCDNCGGRCTGGRPTPYCPWCGLAMDERMDEEIE